jgi:hypothetical protein
MSGNSGHDALTTLASLVAEWLATSPAVPKLARTKADAARALSVSVDHFERHVMPDLRVIRRSGRPVLIPARELERCVVDHAAYPLGALR